MRDLILKENFRILVPTAEDYQNLFSANEDDFMRPFVTVEMCEMNWEGYER